MLGWMLYATAVGAALSVAAWLAERGVRSLGLPVRRVWLAAMVATVLLPMAAAAVVGVAGSSGPAPPDPSAGRNEVVLALWVAVSTILVTSLRMSAWTLRRNERSWRDGSVEGQRVKLSSAFGPGVIGASRPRVVLPEWVVGSPDHLRRLVIRHELEHVRARDPRLLTAGVALAVLVPWCLPLWWQLARLREAVEADCDARVLASAGAREYARALVAIAGRSTTRLLPVPALAPRRSALERRVRLITAPSGRSRRRAAGSLAATFVLLVAIGLVPPPATVPTLTLPALRSGQPPPLAERPRGVEVYLSVEGG